MQLRTAETQLHDTEAKLRNTEAQLRNAESELRSAEARLRRVQADNAKLKEQLEHARSQPAGGGDEVAALQQACT